MFNNVALDIFIGLIFVFLLYSLMASILQEIIATRFAFRAKVLEKGILRMLEDGKTTGDIPYMDRIDGILHIFNLKNIMKGKTVAPWFYAHPLIKYLAEDNWYSKPAYISSSNFSKVMIDLLKGMDQPASQSLQAINDSIMNGWIHKIYLQKPDLANPAVKQLNKMNELEDNGTVQMSSSTAMFLQSLWQDSGADVTVFQAKLEQWFNDTMERTTGWFKKYTRIVLFVIGFALAFYFNVDSLAIRRILTNNRPAREQMVSMAIANHDNLNPGNILGKDSSLLDSTYKLVAADAEKANNVLGLGKPWKDTLSMWKDSLKCVDFHTRFNTLEQNTPALRDSIQILNDSLKLSIQLLKVVTAQKDSLKNPNDSIRITDSFRLADNIEILQQKIQNDKDTLAVFSAPMLKYNQIKFLKERSEYINQQVGNKWFLYGPNQAGGWETFFGWIITALAVMLGAPFWFDLLSKFISLRGTGTKIDASGSTSPIPAPVATAAATSTQSSNNNADQEAVG